MGMRPSPHGPSPRQTLCPQLSVPDLTSGSSFVPLLAEGLVPSPTCHHYGLVWQGPLSLCLPCVPGSAGLPLPLPSSPRENGLPGAKLPCGGGGSAEPPSGCSDEIQTREATH